MSRPRSIRVLIADDNRTVRRGLRLRLEHTPGMTVIGEAASGTDAIAIARAERADVVLMDIEMPGMNGIDATRVLTSSPGRRAVTVIVMTSHADEAHVVSALDAGASGYLLKTHDAEHLVAAIREALDGGAMISPQVTPPLLRELARRRPTAPDLVAVARLSPAERRVVAALASGVTGNEELAVRLGLSVNTVRSQLSSVLRKLGLDDRTQLALWALRNGIDSPPA